MYKTVSLTESGFEPQLQAVTLANTIYRIELQFLLSWTACHVCIRKFIRVVGARNSLSPIKGQEFSTTVNSSGSTPTVYLLLCLVFKATGV